MLRKDRTVIEPKCQFGIECNYLRGEVEGTGGPPCRYFHPREHYEKLSKGRNVNQGSFDPLRAQSKVKSFTAEVPSHRPIAAAPRAPATTQAKTLLSTSLLPESSMVVVECLTATSVRSGPRFADASLLTLPAKSLCCGRTTRITDGNVEWLELMRAGSWVPLVNTSVLVLDQRSRFFRLNSSGVQRPPSFPVGDAGPNLNAGLTVHVVATLELPTKTLGCLAISHCWIELDDCDEVESEDVLLAIRLSSDGKEMQPRSMPSVSKQWALPKPLQDGSVLTANWRLRIVEEGRSMTLLGTVAGWLPEGACSVMKLERGRRRFRALRNLRVLLHPDLGSVVSPSSEVVAGATIVVTALLRRRGTILGFVPGKAGWCAVQQGGETTAEEEEEEDDEEVEKEEAQQKGSEMCSVCLSRRADCGLLHGNTMHRCACSSCAKSLTVCPICRAIVERVVTVF